MCAGKVSSTRQKELEKIRNARSKNHPSAAADSLSTLHVASQVSLPQFCIMFFDDCLIVTAPLDSFVATQSN